MRPPGREVLVKFGVSDPSFVAHSTLADVWKVQHPRGLAALKIYHGGKTDDEWPGFTFIAALRGAGAVDLYDHAEGVAVMEWLDGPSLGDVSRGGDDIGAAKALAEVAANLHGAAADLTLDLSHVRSTFGVLINKPPPNDVSAAMRARLQRCRKMALDLLQSAEDDRPLHGDLHHDNVMLGPRGWTAFDAKGVIGPRAYDYANMFRNPVNAQHLYEDPARAWQVAEIWGHSAGIRPHELLQWAAVRAALSFLWGGDDRGASDRRVMTMLLALLDDRCAR